MKKTIAVGTFMAILIAAAGVCAPPPQEAKELEVGAKAPDFKLKGVDEKQYQLADLLKKNKAVVVTFTCNSCPVAQAYQDRLIAIQKEYRDKGVQVVAINSNDRTVTPPDSFEEMQKRAKEKQFNFPYTYDETQSVARGYGAKVTPHIFLVNPEGVVIYRGAIDNNQDPKLADKAYLRAALNQALTGQKVATPTTKAFGCTIKWKKEPPQGS
jgi:peroxiredoxin